jgi:protein-S-isoprenylcysteine O-methyltransferase Ste14
MLTGPFQSAVILITAGVHYGVDFWLMRRYDRLRYDEGSGRSWGYTALMMGALAVFAAQPIVLPLTGARLLKPWGVAVQVLGITVLTGALALHWWARAHLWQFYVEDVLFREGHKLVDTGPYRYGRRPVFTSFLMIALGVLLVNPAVPTLSGHSPPSGTSLAQRIGRKRCCARTLTATPTPCGAPAAFFRS